MNNYLNTLENIANKKFWIFSINNFHNFNKYITVIYIHMYARGRAYE